MQYRPIKAVLSDSLLGHLKQAVEKE